MQQTPCGIPQFLQRKGISTETGTDIAKKKRVNHAINLCND